MQFWLAVFVGDFYLTSVSVSFTLTKWRVEVRFAAMEGQTMAGELMQHEEQPTRYGAWLEEKRQQEAAKIMATPATEQHESAVSSDEEEEPMVRERGPKRTVGLRVDPEIYEEFEDQAELAGKSVSEFLRDLLVSSESPVLKRKRLRELLKKAVSELRIVASQEGPRKRRTDLLEALTRGPVVEEPHEATTLADKIEKFITKHLSDSNPRGR